MNDLEQLERERGNGEYMEFEAAYKVMEQGQELPAMRCAHFL